MDRKGFEAERRGIQFEDRQPGTGADSFVRHRDSRRKRPSRAGQVDRKTRQLRPSPFRLHGSRYEPAGAQSVRERSSKFFRIIGRR